MIKKSITIAAILLLALCNLTTGCSDDKKVENANSQKAEQKQTEKEIIIEPIDVKIEYVVEKTDGGKYRVSGTTNLPDNTEVMISLSNVRMVEDSLGIDSKQPDKMTDAQFKKLHESSYKGGSNVKIKDGKFSVPFSGKNLAPGQYDLSISMSSTAQTDETVKKLIGNKGENLTGKFVKTTSSTGNKLVVVGKRSKIRCMESPPSV